MVVHVVAVDPAEKGGREETSSAEHSCVLGGPQAPSPRHALLHAYAVNMTARCPGPNHLFFICTCQTVPALRERDTVLMKLTSLLQEVEAEIDGKTSGGVNGANRGVDELDVVAAIRGTTTGK